MLQDLAIDFQTGLIALVVFAISATIVYVISVFSIKETTYEEAIAEQRRRTDILLPAVNQSKGDKGNAAKDRRHKKWGRKSKEKVEKKDELSPTEDGTDSETETGNGHPIVVNPLSDIAKKSSVKAIKEDKKKAAKSPKATTSEPPESRLNVAPKITDDVLPNETKSKKIETASKETASPEPKKEEASKPKAKSRKDDESESNSPVNGPTTKAPKEEIIPKPNQASVVTGPSPSKKTRKNKSDSDGNTHVNVSKLLNSLQAAPLADSEIQALIDLLLNRQQNQSGDEWLLNSGRPRLDSLAVIKKQLADKETQLAEEQQLAQTSAAKVKELRQELNSEKTRCATLERACRDKNAEYQQLQGRFSQTQGEVQALQSKHQQAQAKLLEEFSTAKHHLVEENNQLQQTIAKLDTQLKNKADDESLLKLRQELESLQASHDQLEAQSSTYQKSHIEFAQKIKELEAYISQLETEKEQMAETLSTQVQHLQLEKTTLDNELKNQQSSYTHLEAELQKMQESKNATESNEVQSLRTGLQTLEKENQVLKQQVTEKQSIIYKHENEHKQLVEQLQCLQGKHNGLEAKITDLQARVHDSEARNYDLTQQLQAARDENENLASQLSSAVQREAGEGQEDNVINGDVQHEDTIKGDVNVELEEIRSRLGEKNTRVEQLSVELHQVTNELSQCVGELTRCTTELNQRNTELTQSHQQIEKLTSDITSANVEITRLRDDCELQRQKNDDKCEATRHEVETSTKHCLERLFPSISLSDIVKYDTWLAETELAVSNHLASLQQQIKEKDSRIAQLAMELEEASSTTDATQKFEELLSDSEDYQNKLKAQVQHYKTVLEETENVLNILQRKVEVEEVQWKEKLQAKENELAQVLKEKRLLEDEKSTLEQSLVDIRAAEEAEKIAFGLREQLSTTKQELQQVKMDGENSVTESRKIPTSNGQHITSEETNGVAELHPWGF